MGRRSSDDRFLRRAVTPLISRRLGIDRAERAPRWVTSDLLVTVLLLFLFGLPAFILLGTGLGWWTDSKPVATTAYGGKAETYAHFVVLPLYIMVCTLWASFGAICFYLLVWKK